MTTLAVFSALGGVGQTTIVSHLAWTLAERGVAVLAVDLDPQAHLTSAFLTDERVESLWRRGQTVASAICPLREGRGDISAAHIEEVADDLYLLAGDLALSGIEDLLAESWGRALEGDRLALNNATALRRMISEAASRAGAAVVLMDFGPTLGPLNRAALFAADHVIIPLAPEPLSLRALECFGPVLGGWRRDWTQLQAPDVTPSGSVLRSAPSVLGYILANPGARDALLGRGDAGALATIPGAFRSAMLSEAEREEPLPAPDPFRLAAMRHHRSLLPLARAAKKAMFQLKPADGARGALLDAARVIRDDHDGLVDRIGERIGGFLG